MNFLDYSGLQRFLDRLKAIIPTKTSDIQNDSGYLTQHNPVDSSLSDTSENAVQNKVVKGALDGKSDTGHTHTASEVSGLSTVATSGSYNDLSNTPTIPTVNNAKLTIQRNGTTVKTFTANASSNVTANITVPTAVSELTNDSGYLTSSSTLDSSKLTGTIDIARLPKGALERLVTVANQTARFALTTSDVQLGDTVKQLDTGVMYIVTDESKLSSADGYTEYTAGSATSVPWSGVTGKPSSFTPSSHTHGNVTNDGKLGTASRALITNNNNEISVSNVTATELNYLSGVTSNIQSQLGNKATSSHSHGNIANGGTLGTASRALITDSNKKITTSSVTSTELGYVSGVTSAIQTQLNGKSDTGHTHSASEVSGLSTVATSGSYDDLSNKPTIPTVNNATLTIQKNGSTVKTFTANASSNVTANITVPTKTSDLTNDSGFLTSHNPIDSSLSSTSTNAVQNKVVNDALTGKSDTGHSHTVSDISDFPTLSTVATSGSYNDLSNKPTIPTVNNKTLTIQKNGTNVATFTANSSSNVTANITVPTNVSELTNDSGYLTASSNLDSSKLTGTIDIARLPKGALERLVTVANQTARFALTTSDVQLGDTVKQLDTGVMYIVSDESKLSSNDGYTEYTAGSATSVPWSGVSGKPSSFTPSSHTHGSITNDGKLGTASRALVTDSSKKIAVSSVTSTELGYLSGVTSAIQTQLNGKSDSGHTHSASEVSGLSTVATTGSYNDLSNKPTIPTVNNATLTIQKNGSTVKTFTANASSNVTANITVPTKTSELTNDSHQTITTDTDTTSAESPAHSGTFTCIDSVTRDSNGHVTKVNTKTITLPSDNNTDTLVAQNYSTANNSYPVVFSNVAGVSSTSNRGNKGTIVNNAIYANPSTGSLYATKLYSGGNEVLTSHQSLSNYSTLANTVKSLSISGKTITVTPGSGSSYTLTTQDTVYTHPTTSGNKHIPSGGSSGQFLGWDSDGTAKWVNNPNTNTDTLMTQNVSTTNATYPVLLVATADATANQGAKTGIFAKSVKVNPSTNVISASGFSGPLTGNVTGNVTGNCSGSSGSCTGLATKATGNANGKELTNTIIKGLSVSGKTITYTQIDGNTGTITTQDTNTDTLMTQNVSTTNATYPVLLCATADATANQGAKTGIFGSGVKVNPSTSTITATTFSGALSGNASTATQFSANKSVTLTGDVTGTASSKAGWSVATTLANSGVTAGTYGPSADVTGNNNATISVPEITVDAKGRVSSVTNRTLTCKNNTYNVYNKTLTIQKNGTNVATFTSNSNTDVTANITVPTKVSELTNDSGFLTSHQSLSNYVTLNGAQTISNTKVFTKKQSIKNTAITNYKAAPSADTVISVEFLSNDNKFWGALSHTYYTTGHSIMALETSNWSTSGTQGHWRIQFGTDKALSPVYFRPEATNTVDLGDSSHQWNKVYAKDCYHITSDQSFNIFKDTVAEVGVIPSSSHVATFVRWNDKNWNEFGYSRFVLYDTGVQTFEINVKNKRSNGALNSNGTEFNSGLQFILDASLPRGVLGIFADTRPYNDNTYDLGSSSYRWKTLNGTNPGALSFPNLEYSDSNKWISIKSAIRDTAGADNWYYPAVDGWIFIIASGGAAPDLNVLVFIGSTGTNFISGAIPAAETSTGARWCQCLAPAGSRVRIRFNKGSTSCSIEKALFIPCQGNT